MKKKGLLLFVFFVFVSFNTYAQINASITYHSYDVSSGWVTFRIVNNGATLECVKGHIVNRSTNANYYGPYHSDLPFRTSPTQLYAGDSSMSAGQTRYLRFKLSGNPTGVPCRATITLYTGEGMSGASAVKIVNFDLPGINATITYHSYDVSSGWVTFRIVNSGLTLECVKGHIVNRSTNANYYGPYHSDVPFRVSPTQPSAGDSSMSVGQTRYLRYKLSGNPTGVPCRATLTLYTADNMSGGSAVKTVNFDLPGINATITYHSYDASSGIVTFRIFNSGLTLECVKGYIVNRSTNANYYGPAHSNSPFRASPTQSSAGYSSMSAGETRYLRYNLTGKPTGVPCRATLTLYTADNMTGASSVKIVDFDLPGSGTSTSRINASITYHSYDASTGWVTFRIVNNGATLECERGHIVNRSNNANYYGPYISNSPFRASPTQLSVGYSSMSAGQTRYLRFKLTGNPTRVPCRATLTLYTADNMSGASAVKIVNFDL